MRFLALLIPLFPAFFGPATPSAPPPADVGAVVEQIEFAYYDIEGDTPQALSSALATHGPTFNGHRFFGMTEWSLSADYRVERGGSGCTLADLTVTIDVETSLPHWSEGWQGEAALRTQWYGFLGALDRHERGHRDLAREAADAVRQRLAAFQTDDCTNVRRDAHRVAVDVMNEYDARHAAYDISTGHGRTQGAVWPRPAHPVDSLFASAD